jgi:hypothetical protein
LAAFLAWAAPALAFDEVTAVPYQESIACHGSDQTIGVSCSGLSQSLAGLTLLQYVSVSCAIPADDGHLVILGIATVLHGSGVEHYLSVPPQSTVFPKSRGGHAVAGGQQVQLYADARSNIRVFAVVGPGTDPNVTCTFALSGEQSVTVPQP